MKEITPEYQKELFSKITQLGFKVGALACFCQNDLERMLTDDIVTKKQIGESIEEHDNLFNDAITELNKLKDMSRGILVHYSSEPPKVESVVFDGHEYEYVYRLPIIGDTCLSTIDPQEYCSGIYTYSVSNPHSERRNRYVILSKKAIK